MFRNIPRSEIESNSLAIGFGIGSSGGRKEDEDRGSLEHQLFMGVSFVCC